MLYLAWDREINISLFFCDVFVWKWGPRLRTSSRCYHGNKSAAPFKKSIFVHPPEHLTACKIWRGVEIFISQDVWFLQRLVLKFKGSRVYQMLSLVHSVVEVEVGQNHPETGGPITKPEIIHDCNKFMGAIDRCYQMVVYSYLRWHTMKWSEREFFHLFSLSILNAYILCKQRTQWPVLQRTFQKELVKELVRNSGISRSLTPRGHARSAKGLTHLEVGGHFPEKILGTWKKSNITWACMVCFPAQKEILKRTWDKRKRPGEEFSFQCSVCKVALCMQDRFQLYPTVQDYVTAYVRRHDANNDSVDAKTNWLTDHNHYSSFVWFC